MNPLRFGIIGCGTIAPFHAKALAALGLEATLVAAQSSKPENAAKVAEAYGQPIAHCLTVAELVARPDVEAVCICTPSGQHQEDALAAARAGKHVVVEKPLEITLTRCDTVIDACRQAGVRLCTIFPSRFGEANQELKQAITAGRFGRLTLADTTVKWWRPQSYYDNGQWRGTWAMDGGGALMNQAIHNVDLLLWLMGPVAELFAFTECLAHERIEVEDTAVAALKFANGALGTLTATTAAHPGLLKTVAVHGDRGSVVIEQDRVVVWRFAEETPADEEIRQRLGQVGGNTGGAADPKAISFEGHRRQLADFIHAIRTGQPPLVDGAEGRRSVELITAIYQSRRTGQAVHLARS
jgi:UDP-N-acetyl-2-amino-2-deoxyglucuronate dehydrogenase